MSDKNGGQRTDVGRNGIRGKEVFVIAKAHKSFSEGSSLGIDGGGGGFCKAKRA